VQLPDGRDSYSPVQSPGSCTEEGSDLIPGCRIHMHQNWNMLDGRCHPAPAPGLDLPAG